ncbi:hypothetical protein GQ43DRAFT_482462, partial [Delitschia confertaspora ATCC 74209]
MTTLSPVAMSDRLISNPFDDSAAVTNDPASPLDSSLQHHLSSLRRKHQAFKHTTLLGNDVNSEGTSGSRDGYSSSAASTWYGEEDHSDLNMLTEGDPYEEDGDEGSIQTESGWSNEHLTYLVSILFPDQFATNQIHFWPHLDTLQDLSGPIHLKLLNTVPQTPTPSFLSSSHPPIGTSRPSTLPTIASSHPLSHSPNHARQSLAHILLSNTTSIDSLCASYNIRATLYSLSDKRLFSLRRGMELMAQASEKEIRGRRRQLRGVGEEDELEVRIEVYLLWGLWELEGLRETIEDILVADRGLRME